MASVVWNAEDFRQDYPQFADEVQYPERQLQWAFNTACLLLDNSESSPVPYNPEDGVLVREHLLYMLCCHLLTLEDWSRNGQSGPVSSVTQGSVSASFTVPSSPGGEYYRQTPCGQSFWQLSLPYRLGGRYYRKKDFHPWG